MIDLPAVDFTDDDETTRYTLSVNPMHIMAIEPIDKKSCFVVIETGIYYSILLSRAKVLEMIENWKKDNVLTKIYKDIKDQQGN